MKKFIKAAAIRALRTFCQVMLGFVAVEGVGFGDIEWIKALSISGVSALASILTSISTGLPEAPMDEPKDE